MLWNALFRYYIADVNFYTGFPKIVRITDQFLFQIHRYLVHLNSPSIWMLRCMAYEKLLSLIPLYLCLTILDPFTSGTLMMNFGQQTFWNGSNNLFSKVFSPIRGVSWQLWCWWRMLKNEYVGDSSHWVLLNSPILHFEHYRHLHNLCKWCYISLSPTSLFPIEFIYEVILNLKKSNVVDIVTDSTDARQHRNSLFVLSQSDRLAGERPKLIDFLKVQYF